VGKKTLKIFFLSDIHVDSRTENYELWQNFHEICQKEKPAAIVIAGDLASSTCGIDDGLRLFADLPVIKMYVPGNHDFWEPTASGEEGSGFSILQKHHTIIPELCRKNDWIYLPGNPQNISGIAFVGSPCWYDYSLMPQNNPFSIDDFRQKSRKGRIWQDAIRCRFDNLPPHKQDEELTHIFFQELKADLETINHKSKPKETILVSHFLFHREFLRFTDDWDFNYFGAFMGSNFYQELFTPYNIGYHICGHLHRRQHMKINGTRVFLNPVGYLREWHTKEPMNWLKKTMGVLEFQPSAPAAESLTESSEAALFSETSPDCPSS
jgi:predicted phosphodiesterase